MLSVPMTATTQILVARSSKTLVTSFDIHSCTTFVVAIECKSPSSVQTAHGHRFRLLRKPVNPIGFSSPAHRGIATSGSSVCGVSFTETPGKAIFGPLEQCLRGGRRRPCSSNALMASTWFFHWSTVIGIFARAFPPSSNIDFRPGNQIIK